MRRHLVHKVCAAGPPIHPGKRAGDGDFQIFPARSRQLSEPLDAPQGARHLLPKSLDLNAGVDGVLISHPHQDHYGLLEDVPAGWT